MITDREKILAIVDNDCLSPSDAIILLEGDGFDRFRKAVSLYNQGQAPKIVFSGNIVDYDYGSFPFNEVLPQILEAGVPECDIIQGTGGRGGEDGPRAGMEETHPGGLP